MLSNKQQSDLFATLHQLDNLRRNNAKMELSLELIERANRTPVPLKIQPELPKSAELPKTAAAPKSRPKIKSQAKGTPVEKDIIRFTPNKKINHD